MHLLVAFLFGVVCVTVIHQVEKRNRCFLEDNVKVLFCFAVEHELAWVYVFLNADGWDPVDGGRSASSCIYLERTSLHVEDHFVNLLDHEGKGVWVGQHVKQVVLGHEVEARELVLLQLQLVTVKVVFHVVKGVLKSLEFFIELRHLAEYAHVWSACACPQDLLHQFIELDELYGLSTEFLFDFWCLHEHFS